MSVKEQAMIGEVGLAYAGARDRITSLVEGLDDQGAATMVPACPEWSVHDVVAHLAGGVTDALQGRLEGLGTDPWTAAQVEARRDRTIAEVLDEWKFAAPKLEELLDKAGELGRQAITDIASHEHDIRGALGVPGARDTDAVRIGLGFAARRLIENAKEHGTSLRVRSTTGLDLGAEDAAVTLEGSDFELLRALTGRRSIDQLRAMRWSGDMDTVIPAFTWLSLHPASSPIEE